MSQLHLDVPDDLQAELSTVLRGRSLEEFSLLALRTQVQRERAAWPDETELERKERLERICEAAFRRKDEAAPKYTALDLVGILGNVGPIGTSEEWGEAIAEHVVREHERGLER